MKALVTDNKLGNTSAVNIANFDVYVVISIQVTNIRISVKRSSVKLEKSILGS